MAATRRTQLLMEPEEFKRLQRLARRRKTSVADLIRSAVRQAYLAPAPPSGPIVDAILDMRLPVTDWKRARKDIEAEHARLS
jgi:predicted DNA-binding ribbon-helix-helix protein